jgi:hypothetical protein
VTSVVTTEPAAGPVPEVRPTRHWQRAALAFVIIAVVMWVVQAVSIRWWGVKAESVPNMTFPGQDWLGGLFRWDGGWYSGIARDGYSWAPGTQSNVAFFPSFPLAQRLVTPLVGDVVLAGIVVSALSGLAATVCLWVWMGRMGLGEAQRRTALLVALLYPYGVFLFGVVYGDSLFLLACLGAFLLAEWNLWWLAGLVGIVATAGRPTGIALPVGLLFLALERGGTLSVPGGDGLLARWKVPTRVDLRRLRAWQVLPALISAGGLLAYSTYLWERWGDPMLFSSVQKYWGQPSGWETWTKQDYLRLVTHTDYAALLSRPQSGLILGTRTLQGLILLAVLVAVPFVGRRFGWGYAAFVGTLVAVAVVGTKDFHGSGRYMMAAFPVFVVLGEALSRRPALARGWLVGSALLSVAAMAFYAHGVYLT